MKEPPWVIVEHCGCANERVVHEFDTYEDADIAYYECYTDDAERQELGVEIMRRCLDGTLTTEY